MHRGHTGQEGRASDMQHWPRVSGGHLLCASVLLMRCSLPLRPKLHEDVFPRIRGNGARKITYQVTCPNPSQHDVHQDVDLRSLLQQI